jgi:hypothetical protein
MRLPILVAFVSGGLMIVGFFLRGEQVEAVYNEGLLWQSIITGFSLVMGVVSIVRVHWRKLTGRNDGAWYSAVLLLCFVVMAGFGVLQGTGRGTRYDALFNSIQAPMMSTMFSMLAFFIASAAYRAFRARTVPSLILLVTAVIVMLGRIPMGQFISDDLPTWVNWIMTVPNVAVQRGILIGAALGGASMSLRIFLGIERTYLGQ